MIVLDTHALVWWVSDPKRVPIKARRLVDAAAKTAGAIVVSSISVWEISLLVAHRRLQLTIDTDLWIAHIEALPFLKFVPVDNRVAARSVHLVNFPHRDPADRMIVATALGLNATLITGDRRLRAYGPVNAVWD